MTPLKTAIIGCGGIAQVHGEVLHQLETADVVAYADIRLERAQAMAEKYGGRAYDSMDSLLAREDVQVVHLCTPHVFHTPMAAQAAERGIHVFTEKPPVINEAQWEQFRALGEKVRVGVCFQNRWNPGTRLLQELLEDPGLGAVLGGRAFVTWRREAPYYTESGWRGALATEGGGVLINQSIHTLDLLGQFLGRATAVDATLTNHHLQGVIEVEDTFEARIAFGDKPALFFASTGHVTDSPVLLEIVCEHATLRLEDREITIFRSGADPERIALPPQVSPATGKAYWGASHGLAIQDFYQAILEDAPFPCDIPGVTDTVELMLAGYRSAREGHPVTL